MDDQLKSKLVTGVVASYFLLLLVFVLILFLVVRYRKKKKENEELTAQYKQALLQAELEIKEQTLLHIGQELHDNLGQIASLIKIQLNTLPAIPMGAYSEKIETTKELVRQLILDIKQLSLSLNSDSISRTGLVALLQNEMDKLTRTGIWEAELLVSEDIPPLHQNNTLILYRMSQEILNNIIKHSGGNKVSIRLSTHGKLTTLAYKDNGKGFDPALAKNSSGTGLLNLEHRAKLINADLRIESQPGAGSLVTIQFPS